MNRGKKAITYGLLIIFFIVFFLAILFYGSVKIPAGEIMRVLGGSGSSEKYIVTIITQTRLPMAIGAACCGATLSVAGLMMQTLFQNPLAGPSVLGISSGASFGVAILILGFAGTGLSIGIWQPVATTLAALAGGMMIILILFLFSAILKSAVTLLIVGLMISYLCSSGIALLNYFSPADEIRSYIVWGMGSFTGLRLESSLWLLVFSIVTLIPSIFFIKPLNALLLGERYLESVGYSIKNIRIRILIITGLLVAVPTAFCGPIGFVGLIVPHLCRMLFRTSHHGSLLPASMIGGAVVTLACAFLSVVPSGIHGVLPVNVITPLIGVPVILYLLVNHKRLPYFS